MVFFVDSSTNMNDERVFLVEQPVCGGEWVGLTPKKPLRE